MSKESVSARSAVARSGVSLEAALVAQRYYIDDRQKSDIAAEMGISRFRVARLLEEAKSSGIVRIYIDMPPEVDLDLGAALERAFGVRRVIVARDEASSTSTVAALRGRVAAEFLQSTIGPRDTLGISWGASVSSVVDAIEHLPPIDIVQIVGGVRAAGLELSGTELVRRLSQLNGGGAFPLLAPLIVDSAATARALRSDAAIAEAMSQFDRLSVALVGIGSWSPVHSAMAVELSAADRAKVLDDGVCADVCGVLLNANGQAVGSAVVSRMLSISLEQLRAVPTVVAVAGGIEKVAAIRAAVSSGTIDVLVTDSSTGHALLTERNSD